MVGRTFLDRYRVQEILGESDSSAVYKAADLREGGRPVALKVLKADNASRRLEDIIRFQAEADLVSRFSHPRVCSLYAFGESEGQHYIVMEYVDGLSLRDFIRTAGRKDDFGLAADIGIGICEALDYVHRQGVIHKDLKPGNVLVSIDPATGALSGLKLIDFGLSRLKKPGPGNESGIAGTLQYIAPEQTGLLRKGVDERSDLYSLGALLYELLTRRPPFDGERVSTLIHQHIARRPEPSESLNAKIPPVLGSIVLKLLEKEQDDRYQSAGGLAGDLRRFRSGERDFLLGTEDKLLKLHFRTRLTGREGELDALKSALRERGSVILISGEAGIGKSRLVEELKESVAARGMTYLDAKCNLSENKTPYGPFTEILNDYVKDFIGYTEQEKEATRGELELRLRESGGIILRLNPRMREVIGDFPPPVALEPEREQQRFIRAAGRFFMDLSEVENGLVVFLDDVQWMDDGSFRILEEMAASIADRPLYLIGAYRSDEVGPGHGVLRLKEACAAASCPLREISLSSFDLGKMNQFVSGLLFSPEGAVSGISDFICRKSRGNPFFALEVLKQMIAEKAVVQEDGNWRIAKEALARLEVPTSIVDILLKRISLLGEREMAVLSYAAVIGKVFDLELLFELGESPGLSRRKSVEEILSIVEKAKELQLIEEDAQRKGRILFVHDRIRDAFYKKIGDERRKALHGAIGEALERAGASLSDQAIFDLAGHFIEAGNAEKSVTYAIPAGLAAKDSYGNVEAVRYLTIAKGLLEEKGLAKSPEWIQCVKALCEVYLLLSENDEVIRLDGELLPLLSDAVEKAAANMRISRAFVKKWDYRNCIRYGIAGLELLGEKPPMKPAAIYLSILREFAAHLLHGPFHRVLDRKRKESADDEKFKLIIWFYYSLSTIYVMSYIPSYVRDVLRALNLAESKLGASRELALALTGYTTVVTSIPLFGRARFYNRRALAMSERIGDAWGEGKCHQFFGFLHQWKAEFRKSNAHLRKGIDLYNRISDVKEIGFCLDMVKTNHIYLSEYADALRVNREYYEISRSCADYYGIGDSLADSITVCCEAGDIEGAERCLRESEAIDKRYKTSHANFREYVGAALIAKAKGDAAAWTECLERARAEYEGSRLMGQYTCFIYSYLVEAGLAGLETMEDEARRIETMARLRKYDHLALRKIGPWRTHLGAALVVRARWLAANGRHSAAEARFLRGIACSARLERKYDEAVGLLEYGRFLASRGRKGESLSSWAKAYRVFAQLGAGIRLKELGSLLRMREGDPGAVPGLSGLAEGARRSADIVALMRGLVAARNPEGAVDDAMRAILEMTGAQRACAIRRNPRSQDLEIVAEGDSGGGPVSFDSMSLTLILDVLESRVPALTGALEGQVPLDRYQSIADSGMQAVLCFPAMYMGEAIGVCYCDTNSPAISVSEETINALSLLAAQLILSLESASPSPLKPRMAIDMGHFDATCGGCGLTRRETEILLSTVKGLSNREICERYDISMNTLRTHLKSVHSKAGVNDRTELIGLFARPGR